MDDPAAGISDPDLLNSMRRFMGTAICDECYKKQQDEEARRHQEYVLEDRTEKWHQLCPPLYRDTNPDDPRVSQKLRLVLERWDHSKAQGVGVIGSTGKGKTRLMFWRLKPLIMEHDMNVFAISSVKLERCIHNLFADDRETKRQSEDTIARCQDAEILFLDDIGKEKFTERVASQFYDLVEHRTSNLLPTMWTTNMSAAELKIRLGDDKGEPTIRRLKEFSILVDA